MREFHGPPVRLLTFLGLGFFGEIHAEKAEIMEKQSGTVRIADARC
jgi:patatin-like phospholipase/acyl hydrolase